MPSIFWKTILISALMLFLSTLIGRSVTLFLPNRIRSRASFYLAPVFGMTVLVLVASFVGRHFALGSTGLAIAMVTIMVTIALIFESRKRQAVGHAVAVAGFGIVCGGTILHRLFTNGAYTLHNDTFTYLAHSDWLQHHALTDSIPVNSVTAFTSQISMYQAGKLRLGASYLLAFVQGLTDQRWAYDVYPSVAILGIAACCLAVGFPVARYLVGISRANRLALLAIPTLMMGGVMFGALSGFFPQTIGIGIGAALIFLIGTLLRWVATPGTKLQRLRMAAIPPAMLFAGVTYSYSEFMPFVVLAIGLSALYMAWRFREIRQIILYGAMFTTVSIILLNTEISRAIKAIVLQAHIVVGTPVDWSLIGFIGHAFGIHGGPWDGLNWAGRTHVGSIEFWIGVAILLVLVTFAAASWREIKYGVCNGELTPVLIILTILSIFALYFRYLVPSPFPVGRGASWSQFKISDWAGPFVSVLVLLSIVRFRRPLGRQFERIVIVIFALGFIFTAVAPPRVMAGAFDPFIRYYGSPADLGALFADLRRAVATSCAPNAPVYLALNGGDLKAREIVVLFLQDRNLRSDWRDDTYLFRVAQQKQDLTIGDCVVEPVSHERYIDQGKAVGPFNVGMFNGRGVIEIISTTGAFDRENNGSDWWQWVQHRVNFKLDSSGFPASSARPLVSFGFQAMGPQTLTVTFTGRDGARQTATATTLGGSIEKFENVVDMPLNDLEAISIETSGQPKRLGSSDPRMAAWNVRNLTVKPE